MCWMFPCSNVCLLSRLKELDLLKASLAEGEMLARNLTQEAHIAAAITWWRGQNKEVKTSQNGREPHETLREVERMTAHVEETTRGVRVILKDQGNSTFSDSIVDAGEAECLASEGLMEALRRVENMVTKAVKAAHVLIDDAKLFKERMEAISQRVEKALSRSAVTENQLNALKASLPANTQVSECCYSNLHTTVCKQLQVTIYTVN